MKKFWKDFKDKVIGDKSPEAKKRRIRYILGASSMLALLLFVGAESIAKSSPETKTQTPLKVAEETGKAEGAGKTGGTGKTPKDTAKGSSTIVKDVTIENKTPTESSTKDGEQPSVQLIFNEPIQVKGSGSSAGSIIESLVSIACFIFMFKFIGKSLKTSDSIPLERAKTDVSLKDVAGISSVRDDVMSIVNNFKCKDALIACGARLPKGILLVGPPGVGKTLIAKSIANEAGVPMYTATGSDFVEKYVGTGSARVRELFKQARASAPCVLFIDEVDTLGGERGRNSNKEYDNTLNTFLAETDGIGSSDAILLIAATNRLDMLDSAFCRPGRFDRIITINPPSRSSDRREIIDVHLKGKRVSDYFDKDFFVEITKGLSGAEIAGIINNAVIESYTRGNLGIITNKDIEIAYDKFTLQGNPVENEVEKDKWRIAVHEAGHALIGLLLGRKVLKATCIGTSSGAGGFTQSIDDEETILQTRVDLENRVAELYGGLIAETLFFDSPSTGASNDIDRATQILKRLVGTYGLDGTFVNLTSLEAGNKDLKEKVECLANTIYNKTMELATENKDLLERIANDMVATNTVYNLNVTYAEYYKPVYSIGSTELSKADNPDDTPDTNSSDANTSISDTNDSSTNDSSTDNPPRYRHRRLHRPAKPKVALEVSTDGVSTGEVK